MTTEGEARAQRLRTAIEDHRTALGVIQLALCNSTLAEQREEIRSMVGQLTSDLDNLCRTGLSAVSWATPDTRLQEAPVRRLAQRWRTVAQCLEPGNDSRDLVMAVRQLKSWSRSRFIAA